MKSPTSRLQLAEPAMQHVRPPQKPTKVDPKIFKPIIKADYSELEIRLLALSIKKAEK